MLDCLLLYVPKFQNRYPPIGNYTSVQYPTQGIFALADALNKAKLQSKIIHLGLEKNLDKEFSVSKYLKTNNCKFVAFSVQFHQQLYDSLRTAESIKKQDDSTFIVMGGMSASFFAHDILNQFSCVNAIITGEGEKPLVLLAKGRKEGRKDLSSIPNLLWRQNDTIIENPDHYIATQSDIDALDFCNISLMEHYQEYIRMPKIFSRVKLPVGLRWKVSNILSQQSKPIFFALAIGRGCSTNCSYCGGGANAHKIFSGRRHVIFRSPDKVLESMHKLKEYGYQGAYISFDPFPMSDKYYRTLFSRMRQEKLDFSILFSGWSIPSREFLEEYGKTFQSDSSISISPETGSETLRKKIKDEYYSNNEFMETLHIAKENNIRTEVYFSLGLPYETLQDFEQTLQLKVRIKKEIPHAEVKAFLIEIEPMAPIFLYPEKYGIELVRRNLSDFMEAQKDPDYSSMTKLGYYQKNYLDKPISSLQDYEQQLLETKCKYFCDKKSLCRLSGYFWSVVEHLGLTDSKDMKV